MKTANEMMHFKTDVFRKNNLLEMYLSVELILISEYCYFLKCHHCRSVWVINLKDFSDVADTACDWTKEQYNTQFTADSYVDDYCFYLHFYYQVTWYVAQQKHFVILKP